MYSENQSALDENLICLQIFLQLVHCHQCGKLEGECRDQRRHFEAEQVKWFEERDQFLAEQKAAKKELNVLRGKVFLEKARRYQQEVITTDFHLEDIRSSDNVIINRPL